MPLFNVLLSDILNGPASQINPGQGGWDATISQFIKDQKGRERLGLLARMESIVPSNSSAGTSILVCPPGYSCMPLLTLLWLRGGTPASPQHYEWFVGGSGSGKSAATVWAGSSGASYVNVFGLAAGRPMPIWARPDASMFTDLAPKMVPVLDGDDVNLNSLQIRRQAGNSLTLGLWTYGMVWAKSDS